MPKSADKRAARRTAIAPAPQAKSEAPLPTKLDNVALAAKVFLPASETEIDATVIELTPDGAILNLPGHLDVSTDLVLYVEGFDRFSCSVVRIGLDHVRVRFYGSALKRERTAARIAAHQRGETAPSVANPSSGSLASQRVFVRQNGMTADFEVIDISLLGAALRSRCRPPIGEIISIGTTEGRVARYLDGGFAVEFIRARDLKPQL